MQLAHLQWACPTQKRKWRRLVIILIKRLDVHKMMVGEHVNAVDCFLGKKQWVLEKKLAKIHHQPKQKLLKKLKLYDVAKNCFV